MVICFQLWRPDAAKLLADTPPRTSQTGCVGLALQAGVRRWWRRPVVVLRCPTLVYCSVLSHHSLPRRPSKFLISLHLKTPASPGSKRLVTNLGGPLPLGVLRWLRLARPASARAALRFHEGACSPADPRLLRRPHLLVPHCSTVVQRGTLHPLRTALPLLPELVRSSPVDGSSAGSRRPLPPALASSATPTGQSWPWQLAATVGLVLRCVQQRT
mmetsp:Transcript_73957/g.197122  ORF Transcript_73957/g.197122 Transcript_73957/m.197122 type:complete len:215 (+) Transcript_73957:868-1512(+)